MGIGGISIWKLLIILLIVITLFGSKRLKGLGADLGDTIKGFRKSMGNDDTASVENNREQPLSSQAHKIESPTNKY